MNCGLDKKQLDALKRIYKRRGDEAVRKMCEDLGYSYEKVLEDIMGNVVSVAPSSFVEVKEVSHYEGYNPKTSDKTNNIVSYYAESTSRYNKMLADFSRDIISETFLEINSERFAFKNPSGFNLKNRTTNLNANITSYKIRLANELYSILRSDNDFTILESDDGLIKGSKLQSILQLY